MRTGNDTQPKTRRDGIRRILLLVLGNALIFVILLLCAEGAASWLLFARSMAVARPVAERLHTRYDPDLGWVNEPNVDRADMYGPGIRLTTNSLGFRGTPELAAEPPAGMIRVICSGDSFTLGYGVGDADAWCHRLTVLDPEIQSVNMGQGGYGVDQAYLWYRRDARNLKHQLCIFAFILNDFERMTSTEFMGYAKPKLALENGALVVRNVPVPRRDYGLLSWYNTHYQAIQSLRMVELGEAGVRRMRGKRVANDSTKSIFEQTHDLLPVLFADLKRLNDERGSKLVLVRLPTLAEIRRPQHTQWDAFFTEQTRALGVPYIDLREPFRELPEQQIPSMFIGANALAYPAAAGHYTRAGNELVASLLLKALIDSHLVAPVARQSDH